MPAGIQVFDASGNLVFDSTARVLRVLTVSDVHPTSGAYIDPEITPGGTLPGYDRGGVSMTNGAINYGTTRTRHTTVLY